MQGYHLFTFKGIPVSFRPMFILLILILSLGTGDGSISQMLIFAVCAVCGVLFHEFGHALVARHFNLRPEIVLCGWGGITTNARPASAKQDFFITLAGPMAGLVIAGVLYLLMKLLNLLGLAHFIMAFPLLYSLIFYTVAINLIWGIFNLIPVKPMDGSKVLAHILSKFTTPSRAENILAVCSFTLAILMCIYFGYMRNMFMSIIAIYFAFINFQDFANVFRSSKNAQQSRMKKVGIQAEALYEKGLVAARSHDWQRLERLGHQMKLAAENPDQIARAYELLTIACTNLCKYDEAIVYAPRARQTDAVKQAAARCKALLK